MTEEAPESKHRKLLKALEAGRIDFSDNAKKSLARMNLQSPDFTVTEAVVTSFWGPGESNKGGLEISWGTVSAGCGSLTIFLDKDGKLQAETEGMNKDFCKEVVLKMLEDLIVPREM